MTKQYTVKRCIHTVKSTTRIQVQENSHQRQEIPLTQIYSLSIILTNNMYLHDHSSEKNQAYP